MTAAEWDGCTDPERMLTAAGRRLSDRKALLFACGCARRVWDDLPEALREAVPRVELAADVPDPDERAAAIQTAVQGAAAAVVGEGTLLGVALMFPAWPTTLSLVQSATYALRLVEHHPGRQDLIAMLAARLVGGTSSTSPAQADVLRCVAGNPFRRVRFRREWRTSDVLALAAGAYAERAFDRLPILADALQDAGCTDGHVLGHLLADTPHARGCWVLDRILGKE
jgi:hypothetical protein